MERRYINTVNLPHCTSIYSRPVHYFSCRGWQLASRFAHHAVIQWSQ